MVSDREFIAYLRQERKAEMKSRTGRAALTGFFLGALAGVAAGVLMAPRPGAETRRVTGEKLVETLDLMKETIGAWADDLNVQVDGDIDKIKE